ncbi:hypothetical protein [Patiriisocius sp. Uisw_017]|uniref:hypothetical protein n=1 Tax=Patiriisocius sp. Uisw_017 TaxID=3230968 RepID=UPI0039E98D52
MKKITQNYFIMSALLFLCTKTVTLRQWLQLGNDILGLEQFDANGRAIALSGLGNRLAITSISGSSNALRDKSATLF